MALNEGDIVLCIVDRIVGTVVFVKIEGEEREGSIILSEIAPGRIRNLRDYVVPKKKIACKVLRISPDTISLSLRRVTQKEKSELMEEHSQEKSYESLLKNILGEKSNQIIDRIKEKGTLLGFFEQAKQNPQVIEKLVGKENAEKIMQILKKQKIKKITIKREFILKSAAPDGLELLKNVLGSINDAEINYLAAGKYLIKMQSENPKKEEKRMAEILESVEKKAGGLKMEFSAK